MANSIILCGLAALSCNVCVILVIQLAFMCIAVVLAIPTALDTGLCFDVRFEVGQELFGLHELFVGLINGVDALKFIEYAVHDIATRRPAS